MTAVMGSQQIYEVQHSGQTQQLTFSSPRPAQAQPPRLGRQSIDLRSLPLAQRLSCIPGALAARFEPGTLALVQVWTACVEGRWAGVSVAKGTSTVFRCQPMGASLQDPVLAPFRASCCEGGILRSAIGMLGKVWSSGALAVVQNVAIIPTSVHPRNKLGDDMAERVAELAYIPVHDLRQPEAGVVACLEVMMSSFATSALVANVISHTCDLLTQFQLSLGKPAASPPAVTASPSPFAAAAGAPPPHMFGRASLDFARPLLSPGHSVFGRASMDSRPLPPLERHLRSAATAPPIPCWAPGGGGSSGGYSGNGSYSSTGSGPESPGTPTAAPPMLRKLSMQRTASIRRLDSLADMNIG